MIEVEQANEFIRVIKQEIFTILNTKRIFSIKYADYNFNVIA